MFCISSCLICSYQFCDNCFIYPITPSTPMATNADAYASRGVKNVFGQVGYEFDWLFSYFIVLLLKCNLKLVLLVLSMVL